MYIYIFSLYIHNINLLQQQHQVANKGILLLLLLFLKFFH